MSGLMQSLFGDTFYPATKSMGFIRSSPESLVHAYSEWFDRLGHTCRIQVHEAPLRTVMPLLEPLTGDSTRIIVAATRSAEWSAIFDNLATGGDPVSDIAVLTKARRTDGVLVGYSPDERETPDGKLGRLGARVFRYTEYDPGSQRSIAPPTWSIYLARQSGSKWLFEAKGEPLSFEDLNVYEQRRVKDRFTPEMLERYCRELGIDPFDEDFYPGPCYLVEKHVDPSALGTITTFEEQQRKWQIVPGS
ncbi:MULTISPECIES: hypothetical protein [Microbacterium]|uniref:hypothetical protein n=1 Tax=Microbacterium TaxID=33882 RepID=UPI0023DA21C8|nr:MULTISPECIES: hypothetical protein [Microbacterium]MDF2047030.1 hypothetical protein [Microbacterium sp. Kw_RZR3]MDQ1076878.1 hypothetical protein [Microbacterium sp. SORGH_AS_0969]MDQ1117115.1 hypothetical protein [Microbacterium testaceum]